MARKFLVPIDLTLNELQNFKFQSLASAPSGAEALVYWNSTTKDLLVHDGTGWLSLIDAGAGTTTLTGDVTGSGAGTVPTTIAAGAVSLAKMANVATGTLFYRKTAGTGAPEVQTLATLKTDLGLTGTNSGDQTITLTGDVTGTGTGSFAATIANNTVTLAKMADMATASFIGRNTASTGDPEILSTATARTMLSINNVDNTSDANKPVSTAQAAAIALMIPLTQKGAASGVATLDGSGKVPAGQLPSYVDDVVEVANFAALPGTGETGKIYITIDTGYTYRWTGSVYVRVGASALTADEALKLTTPRNIAITGDLTWNVNFDGSANVTAAGTLANSGIAAGTYNDSATQVRPITFDAKGRATGVGTAVTITPAWGSVTGKPTTVATSGLTDAVRFHKAAIVGGATSEVITHNFGTRDVIVQLVRVASPYDHIECDIESTTTNTVTLRFSVSPSAGEYRVIVMG